MAIPRNLSQNYEKNVVDARICAVNFLFSHKMLSYLNHHDRLDLEWADRGVCAPIVKFHAFGQESPVGVASRLPHLRHRRCTNLEPVSQGCSHHIFVCLCSPSVDMRIGYRGWYFQVPGVAMKDRPTARIVGDIVVALFLA